MRRGTQRSTIFVRGSEVRLVPPRGTKPWADLSEAPTVGTKRRGTLEEFAMTVAKRMLLIAACSLVAWPAAATAALPYDITLYRPIDIAKKGIHASIRETQSGTLDCTLRFDDGCVGSQRVTSISLSSTTDDAAVDFELRGREVDGSLECHFVLSRQLLMHGHVTIGVEDIIPGGTFYHVHFVDFVEFGDELPPALKRRQERLIAMEVDRLLPRYEDTTPARGEGADARLLLQGKTAITPYLASDQ